MSFRLKTTDCNILECLAEYRILTVSQVASLFHKSKQAIRRRLHDLEERGLIEVIGTELGRGRGRPENSLGLTERGVDVLKEKDLQGPPTSGELVQNSSEANRARAAQIEYEGFCPKLSLLTQRSRWSVVRHR